MISAEDSSTGEANPASTMPRNGISAGDAEEEKETSGTDMRTDEHAMCGADETGAGETGTAEGGAIASGTVAIDDIDGVRWFTFIPLLYTSLCSCLVIFLQSARCYANLPFNNICLDCVFSATDFFTTI